MSEHINDGTLAPVLAEWLGRYAGTEPWIVEIAQRASTGIAPMPDDLRRLADLSLVAGSGGGWRSAQECPVEYR